MGKHGEMKTIHYSELRPASPGSKVAKEWNLYLRELGRLLDEGHEGKYILIKNEEIIGLFDSYDAAMEEARDRYLLSGQGWFVHQILTYEPLYVVSCYRWSCPTSH
jgi:hypothetical protein